MTASAVICGRSRLAFREVAPTLNELVAKSGRRDDASTCPRFSIVGCDEQKDGGDTRLSKGEDALQGLRETGGLQ